MSAAQAVLDHVALLVGELEPVSARLRALGLSADPIEEFPSEGTREQYLGEPGAPGRVLLLQPLSAGPYQRALDKRGPGLHHLGLRVGDLDEYLAGLSWWLLHPHSLESRAACDTIWLARPGVGALIEVTPGTLSEAPPQVEVGVGGTEPADTRGPRLAGLGARGIAAAEAAWLGLGEERLTLEELLGG